MDHSKEAAVRARAFQLWVESGYADGYQDHHWRQAEREIAEREKGNGEGAVAPAGQQIQDDPGRHSDGVSPHPSVLDAEPRR